jgi:cysteinyl-tRNA synthetase
MSKSLGNFFTARDILKSYSAEAIRLFFSQAYYRGPLNFSDDLIKAAEKGVEKLTNTYERISEELKKNSFPTTEFNYDIKPWYQNFEQALDDDFNTASAVAILFDFSREVNRIISENNFDQKFLIDAKELFDKIAEGIFGLIKKQSDDTQSLEDELIQLLIKLRLDAKLDKNYALSDKIRDELKKLGIILQDSKEGTTYKKSR